VSAGNDSLLADSAAGFAGAIRKLFEDPEMRRGIERQARRTAEEKYNWDRIAEKQSRLYRDLLGKP